MITFKPVVIPGNRRKDGTHPVKIRVTFKGESRRLPTSLACTDADLTRGGKIKNASVLEKAEDLIREMRSACAPLSPFALQSWNLDQVIAHIHSVIEGENFTLDFFAFADSYIDTKKRSTRGNYISALNAFERFLGRRSIDVNEITHRQLVAFVDYVEASGKFKRTNDGFRETAHQKIAGGASSLYIAKLCKIYSEARAKYNDEDAGQIFIPRTPFDGLRKSYPPGKGQDNLGVRVIQQIIDHVPTSESERRAFAVFVVSFALMGVNLADLYHAKPVTGDLWIYNRRKTESRRPDKAEVQVKVPDCLRPFLAALGAKTRGSWWLTVLHEWREESMIPIINRYLRRWAVSQGLAPFTLYAARHSWASIARGLGVEKATVDEALGHVGDYKIADIYAERNWELSWKANERVLALFRWPEVWPVKVLAE